MFDIYTNIPEEVKVAANFDSATLKQIESVKYLISLRK